MTSFGGFLSRRIRRPLTLGVTLRLDRKIAVLDDVACKRPPSILGTMVEGSRSQNLLSSMLVTQWLLLLLNFFEHMKNDGRVKKPQTCRKMENGGERMIIPRNERL